MKSYLFWVRALAAVFVGSLSFGLSADVNAQEPEELPESVLGIVKAAPPKQLAQKAVAVARQFQPGPQTESLPYIVGGFLGDPTLEGISATENAGLVLLAAGAEPAAVLVLKLTEESPWRQTLPGFELKLRDAEGWTFAAREEAHLAAVQGMEDDLIRAVSGGRAYDIEAALNPSALANKLGELQEILLEEVEADDEPFVRGLIEMLGGELGASRYFSMGMDVNERELAYAAQLRARDGTPLASLLDQRPPEEIPYARFLPAAAPLVYLGGVDMDAVLGYVEHVIGQLEETIPGQYRDQVDEFLESFRYVAERTDGTSAGSMGLEGMQAEILQAAGADFSQEELVEYLRHSVKLMSAFELREETKATYELIENHLSVDDIPVHVIRSEMQLGADLPEGGELPEGFGMESYQQDLHHALVDGVLLIGTDAGRLGDAIRAVRDREEVPASVAEELSLGADELFQFKVDVVQYVVGTMGPFLMMDEEGSRKVQELEARNLPGMSGRISARGGVGEARMSVPIETMAEVFRFFQDQASGGQMEPGPQPEGERVPDQ